MQYPSHLDLYTIWRLVCLRSPIFIGIAIAVVAVVVVLVAVVVIMVRKKKQAPYDHIDTEKDQFDSVGGGDPVCDAMREFM
jgi:type IV secretory pathway component VirB8